MSSERFACLSPRETASNQDEWPRPVASPGILTDNSRPTPPTPPSRRPLAISLGFRAKPQLSSVFVIKRNHPEAKSRLPISLSLSQPPLSLSLALSRSLSSCRLDAPRKSVARSRAEIYRLRSSGQSAAGVSAASRPEWLLVDHLGYAIRQPPRCAVDGDRLSTGKTPRWGKRKVGQ